MSLFSKKHSNKTRRRQWGAEKQTQPLPTLHQKPSSIKITLSRLAVVSTIIFWLIYFVYTIIKQFFVGPSSFEFTMQAMSYLVLVTVLTFSALLYLIMRQGAYQRFAKHLRVPKATIDKFFTKHQPSITVLVPSYSEEPQVIRKTLLSAALQEYPKVRIVLLIDDRPYPANPDVAKVLDQTRSICSDISKLLDNPKKHFNQALQEFESKYSRSKLVDKSAIIELAENYKKAAGGLFKLAQNEVIEDHVDEFFAEQVLRGLAKDLNLTAEALQASVDDGALLTKARVHQLYCRLSWIFNTELEVFERKKYASLSHEANKAMNLNSYIGLMGGHYKIHSTPDGPVILPVNNLKKATLVIPDSDYILTLDADSILLRDYCLRLVYYLEEPGNQKVAVTQTPYSSFRGAYTRIERLAGATTDIQHILHQGMTYYDATFWVGANAVIRKKALEDIAEAERVGGFEIKRYIQDRTVIEDTESSIDLAVHGWKLVNYPERLSYSATPPDFGSLVVQRRRWANGGLIILPKLLTVVKQRRRRGEYVSRMEILIRLNYMASIAWASFGLVLLLAYPFDSRLLSPIVILAALPYFMAMASDLKYCGYKRTDIFRIYGFNLILLPVNLAGVLKSLQQALSGKKIPFARTPKVKNRTASPMIYVVAPLLIVSYSVFTLWRDSNAGNWINATFAGFNALLAMWAILAYIGWWQTIVDIWLGLTKWLFVEVKSQAEIEATQGLTDSTLDWQAVLYHGDDHASLPLAARSQSPILAKQEQDIK